MSPISNSQRASAAAKHRKLSKAQIHAIRVSLESASVVAPRYGVHPDLIAKVRRNNNGRYGELTADEINARTHREGRFVPTWRFERGDLIGVGDPYHPWLEPFHEPDSMERRDAVNECAHGRLPGDGTPPCGCWPTERRLTLAPEPSRTLSVVESERRAA